MYAVSKLALLFGLVYVLQQSSATPCGGCGEFGFGGFLGERRFLPCGGLGFPYGGLGGCELGLPVVEVGFGGCGLCDGCRLGCGGCGGCGLGDGCRLGCGGCGGCGLGLEGLYGGCGLGRCGRIL